MSEMVQGYYDGTAIRPLGEIHAKPNQKVIITILNEYVDNGSVASESMRGVLSAYANPELISKEKEAWKDAATNNDIT